MVKDAVGHLLFGMGTIFDCNSVCGYSKRYVRGDGDVSKAALDFASIVRRFWTAERAPRLHLEEQSSCGGYSEWTTFTHRSH